ncbi:MAG: response regulator transcription factor [Acidiferrobacter sp.]
MWNTMPDTGTAEGLGLITPDLLAKSYARCQKLAVPEDLVTLRDMLNTSALKHLLQQNSRLLSYARLVIGECLRDMAHGRDLFVLTDAEGRILDMWSHAEVLTRASNHGMVAGSALTEASAGTNAVALALALNSPVVMVGAQHLCRIFRDWSCVAIPIVSTDGDTIGCLDISAAAGPLGEKMALARSLARELGRLVGPGGGTPRAGITPRQRQVLALFAQGSSYKEIARTLSISIKTVEEHLDAIRNKMGTKSRRACIKKAVELGIL